MALTKKQRCFLIGAIMGDGFLQKTGKSNARLRLEHSAGQKEYIFWKYEILKNLMQSRPKLMHRFNPAWKKTYSYYRCQSHSGPYLGKLRRLFYVGGRKVIPENITLLLNSNLSLAVWYMDDGSFVPRDKSAYIYLSRYEKDEISRLSETLMINFGLTPKAISKKKKYPCFYFDVCQTRKLMSMVKPYVIPSLEYKLLLTP